MLRGLALLALGPVLLLGAGTAHGQESASEVAMARRLFREGVDAARRRQWLDARTAFERSYELSPRPITLLNLAGAQAEVGLLVEASEGYQRFLSNPGTRSERHVPEARRALDALLPRIAHLRLRVDDLTDGHRLEIDGREVSHAVVDGDLPLNPGEHEIVVRGHDGEEAARTTVTVDEGESRNVRMRVAATTAEVPILPGTEQEEEREGGGAARSPWLWTGLGLVVVGGVVTAVVLTRDGGGGGAGGPFLGNVGTGSWEIR